MILLKPLKIVYFHPHIITITKRFGTGICLVTSLLIGNFSVKFIEK